MTSHDNALDSVRLILNARRRVDTWSPELQAQASLVVPDRQTTLKPWADQGEAWLTVVATFASPDEHPVHAAQRLAQYLLAYQETYGRMPTLASVQNAAANRHLKGPRP